jgi:hypothetical protein
MLACFGAYNNDTGRICAITVTDDYATPLFFLRYELKPTDTPRLSRYKGAFVDCWIKSASARQANEIAHRKLIREGWEVVSHDEMAPASLGSASPDDRDFIAQPCVDGSVFHVQTWSSDEEEH